MRSEGATLQYHARPSSQIAFCSDQKADSHCKRVPYAEGHAGCKAPFVMPKKLADQVEYCVAQV